MLPLWKLIIMLILEVVARTRIGATITVHTNSIKCLLRLCRGTQTVENRMNIGKRWKIYCTWRRKPRQTSSHESFRNSGNVRPQLFCHMLTNPSPKKPQETRSSDPREPENWWTRICRRMERPAANSKRRKLYRLIWNAGPWRLDAGSYVDQSESSLIHCH